MLNVREIAYKTLYYYEAYEGPEIWSCHNFVVLRFFSSKSSIFVVCPVWDHTRSV